MNKKFLSAVLSASMVLSPMGGRSCFADAGIRQNEEENHIDCTADPGFCEEWIEIQGKQVSYLRKLSRFSFAAACVIAFGAWYKCSGYEEMISLKDRIISLKDCIISDKGNIISLKDCIISDKDRVISLKDDIIIGKDRIISLKDN